MMVAMRTWILGALTAALVAACGGPQPAPYVEPDVDGVCKIDPAVAAGRAAKPETPAHCFDPAAFGAVQDACNDTREPGACYDAATCLNVALSTMEPTDPMREATLDSAIAGFRVACDASVAEACVIFASMAEEEVLANREHPRRDELLATMCDGYEQGCRLGEEFDGCARCRTAGCSGLPGVTPAPIRETVGPAPAP